MISYLDGTLRRMLICSFFLRSFLPRTIPDRRVQISDRRKSASVASSGIMQVQDPNDLIFESVPIDVNEFWVVNNDTDNNINCVRGNVHTDNVSGSAVGH